MSKHTLFDKIWEKHVVFEEPGRPTLLYVDLHLVHEVTSPQAFEGLRLNNRKIRRPELTFATMDHNVPTTDRSLPIEDPISAKQIDTLRNNCKDFGVKLFIGYYIFSFIIKLTRCYIQRYCNMFLRLITGFFYSFYNKLNCLFI